LCGFAAQNKLNILKKNTDQEVRMAYDIELVARIRQMIGMVPGMEEKKMFGGVGFIYKGNMTCGVSRNDFVLRIGPDQYEEALARPHTRPFAQGSRKGMVGWITVEPAGYSDDEVLREWIRLGLSYVRTLPPKK
jgi:TfoX/Sxy family transcriptional regulator of competence genes